MRPTKSSGPLSGERRAWEPPTVTKLAIGTETKSPLEPGLARSTEATATPEPQPRRASGMKFGFSFEWSFPLSARTD
jgi:hypothetical protein